MTDRSYDDEPTVDEMLEDLVDDERFSEPELGENNCWRVEVTIPNRHATLIESEYDEVIAQAWRMKQEADAQRT